MIHSILPKVKSLIILNGTLYSQILSFLLPYHLPLIAADGAAGKLLKIGVCPNFIVGDGDSFFSESTMGATMVKIEEQETTDFEKCIFFAKKQSLAPSLVIGINGGEIDHILGNALLMLRHSIHFDCCFLDAYEKEDSFSFKWGIPLTERKKVILDIQLHSLISIISVEKTIVTTKGLKWDLSHGILEPNGLLSLRNENLSSKVEFEVEKGKAMLIVDVKNFNDLQEF